MRPTTTTTRLIAASGAALAAVALAACGPAGQNAADTGPLKGGTLIYGHEQEPPCLIGGWVQEAYIDRQFADSLVSQVDDGKIVPWLATSWSVSADQLTWTFKLKPGVKFTDGTPLDAAAVSTNFTYWLAEKGGNSTVQSYIGEYYDSSRAVDATTLELKLKKPYSPLLSALSQAYFGILSPKGLERGPEANCESPIGSGPFKIEKWNRGQNITFVKNPDYNSAPANAKHQGPAYLDKIVWKFLKEPTVRYGSLTTGQADVIYDVPTVSWQDAKARFTVQQYITPGRPVTLSLNTTKFPTDDVSVRQALAWAMDRKAAVKSAFNEAIPFNGNPALSQSTPDYDASLADAYTHDPAKANALLDQAGWTQRNAEGIRTKNGKPLDIKLVYPAGPVFTQEGATLLQNLQQQVKEVGINIVLTPANETETFSGKYSGPDAYNGITWYWTSPTAGVLYIVWRQNLPDRPNGNNSSFYNNPELEATIAQANSTLDEAEQKTLYSKAQKIVSDNAAAIGLYTQTTSLAWGKNVHDVWIEDSQGEPVFHDAYLSK